MYCYTCTIYGKSPVLVTSNALSDLFGKQVWLQVTGYRLCLTPRNDNTEDLS